MWIVLRGLRVICGLDGGGEVLLKAPLSLNVGVHGSSSSPDSLSYLLTERMTQQPLLPAPACLPRLLRL